MEKEVVFLFASGKRINLESKELVETNNGLEFSNVKFIRLDDGSILEYKFSGSPKIIINTIVNGSSFKCSALKFLSNGKKSIYIRFDESDYKEIEKYIHGCGYWQLANTTPKKE